MTSFGLHHVQLAIPPGLRRELAGVHATPDGAFPGFRRVYVSDPFDNRIELLTPA